MYEKCEELQRATFPNDYLRLSTLYTDIGLVYYRMSNYNRAVDYFQKPLDVQMKSYPSYYQWLPETCANLAWAFYRQGKFSEALEKMKNAYEIASKSITPDHEHLRKYKEWITNGEGELTFNEKETV